MTVKKCFKCGEVKSISEFYKHKRMKDGHLNKCKECSKVDALNHRDKNIDKIREYDRNRGNRQKAGYSRQWKDDNPKKYRAHNMVSNHLRAGNIKKMPCEVCKSEKVVAHHDDYNMPLNIRWLCQAHHKQWHAKYGEGANGK